MKKRKAFLLFSFCFVLFGADYLYGQSASSMSKNIYPEAEEVVLPQNVLDSIARVEDSIILAYVRILQMPQNVLELLDKKQGKEAKAALAAFIDTLPADTDPFYIFFLEKEFLGRLATYGTTGKEQQVLWKRNLKMLKYMRKHYSNRPEVIWYEVDDLPDIPTPEEEIIIATHQIEADSTYLPAYETRGKAYSSLLRWEEACRDFSRLPACIRRQIPEARSCR